MTSVNLQKLGELIQPAVEGQGYELVDLAFRREHGRWIFQVTIDRKAGQGFISHQDCICVSREVSVLLDLNEEMLPGDYHLEVSSPGAKRPLKTVADFVRFTGQSAKIRLKEYAAKMGPDATTPRRNFLGIIQSVNDDKLTLQLPENHTLVELTIKDIEKAHLAGNE